MKNAVRELIRQRQKHSKYVVEEVAVEFVGGHRMNDCFNNCAFFVEQHKNTRRYKVVSGWIVKDFDISSNSTAVIQHYWIYDTQLNKYIDITDNVADLKKISYVIDVDLMLYSQSNYERVDSCVGHSLWYKKRKWHLICGDLKEGIRPSTQAIDNLATRIFFDVMEVA